MPHISHLCLLRRKKLQVLPQLGVRLLADSNTRNVNVKTQKCEADAQEYRASWLLTMFLYILAYFFQPVFKYKIFYFASLQQHSRGKHSVPRATQNV